MKESLSLTAALAVCTVLCGFSGNTFAQEESNPVSELDWQAGPASFAVGSKATIELPDGAGGLVEAESGEFLKLTGNLPSPGTSIIASSNWWAALDFSDAGYVKDDEAIDADALLKQMKSNDGPANEERRRLGMRELYTDGWHVPPHYDQMTKQLEWALRLHAEGDSSPTINYSVRILGRKGYESAVLVSSPETLDRDVAEFKGMLQSFDFNSGEKYAEFKPGDHVAEFGLAALVAGGAAAVATKTGFWKVLAGFFVAGWKLILAGGIALLAGIGRLLGGKRSS